MSGVSGVAREETMRSGLSGQRLVVVSLAGAMLINYPLLSLFDGVGQLAGIPSLYLYVFAVWIGMIALMAWIIERGSR
jgi:hypothetical protein